MNKRLTLACLLLLTVFTLCLSSGGCAPVKPFTLIVLPDTQNYADTRVGYAAQHWGNGDLRASFYRQTEWIRENKDRLNIVMVAHVGDLVQTDYDPEWEIASAAFSTLDGAVPYILCLGNHDMGYAPSPAATGHSAVSRETRFNEYFGPERFESYPWYGGHKDADNNNYYCLFEAGGMKFLIVSLAFKPTDEMLAWAGDIVCRHPDRRCIVLTHSYLRGNERIAHDNYGVSGNSGQAIWEKFVSRHENISMVLCGHTNVGRLSSRGRHGNEVHQVLCDYQSWQDGGQGYLRMMTFVPGEDRIDVRTFSPVSGDYVTTEQDEFSLDYPMKRARYR